MFLSNRRTAQPARRPEKQAASEKNWGVRTWLDLHLQVKVWSGWFVKSSTKVLRPLLMQGAKQMRAKRRCGVDIFELKSCFLVWFELPRKESKKGGGVGDDRGKVHPFIFGGSRPRDTATVRLLRWQRFLYRLRLRVANQGRNLRSAFV